MYIVTNFTDKPVTRGAIEFKPGENKIQDARLSEGKRAQISADKRLKWVHVDDTKQKDKSAK